MYYGSGKAQNTAVDANLTAPLVDLGKGVLVERGASVSETRSIYFNYNLEAYLNYEKSFGVHKNHRAATADWLLPVAVTTPRL